MTTIYALSSPPGRGGVALIRITGPAARQALLKMASPLPKPRRAVLRAFRCPESAAILDYGLVLWFPAPASFTGEDMVEFHCHGGRAVTMAMLAGLALLPDYRLAEAGEFTRRAFRNGRVDLVEIEALADLIAADTEAQRRQAVQGLDDHGLAGICVSWRDRLLSALAQLEAMLDFPDDVDETAMIATVQVNLDAIIAELRPHLDGAWRNERLRDGIRVVLLGPPNVGKSSLLNALARRDAALVAAEPGTTRDIIEVSLDLGGYPVVLSDMAGLREDIEGIEAAGVARARLRAAAADLILWVAAVDGDGVIALDAAQLDADLVAKSLPILNKIDLVADGRRQHRMLMASPEGCSRAVLAVSARDGEGLADLEGQLTAAIEAHYEGATSLITRARQREVLSLCRDHLLRFATASRTDLVLATEDVRLALRELGRLAGQVGVEDILDVIFREFCIGK